MGIDVGQELSPSLLEKSVYIGVLLKSFPQGATAIEKLIDMVLGRKRLERLTERIGTERIQERDQERDEVEQLTLMQKIAGPAGVTPPVACAVMADGGRVQRTECQPDSKTHWVEYKAGLCLELGNLTDAQDPTPPDGDPCPQVPPFLMNFEQVETLTREIGQQAAGVDEPDSAETATGTVDLDVSNIEELITLAKVEPQAKARSKRELPLSPRVKRRDVVATLGDIKEFSRLLVARVWKLGLFQAKRKAFVGDGGTWIWRLWEREFKAFGFVPILDIIHAVTYVFAAATAGRLKNAGWPVYQEWITWIWQGEVGRVIAALETRQKELGEPTEADGDTSPRTIVADTLRYLRNQQSRMNYPEYRKQGLPITSSHMESTIKELNFRIKGSEKFWGESGGEAVLQLRADTLCDSDPLKFFWQRRVTNRTGFHSSAGASRRKRNQAA